MSNQIVGSTPEPGDFHIFQATMRPEQMEVMEEARRRIARVMGVTWQGNRLTVRFTHHEKLCDVHMVILEVEDWTETPEEEEK